MKIVSVWIGISLIFLLFSPMVVSQVSTRDTAFADSWLDGWLDKLKKAPGTTIQLEDIDSGLTSPTGKFRWLDVADQAYSPDFQDSYDYTQADVEVTYRSKRGIFQGTLDAGNLKPNFAYQLKLVGYPDIDWGANERIGLAGRWRQEEWDGSSWISGQNLNDKGDGTSPNPNDDVYFARRDIEDPTSPTGYLYRLTGYLVLAYFITDEFGNATIDFKADSSFHVLWKTSQEKRTRDDGPIERTTFDPDPSSYGYPEEPDYGKSTVKIFGEWERLPMGKVYPEPGNYTCQIILTEESFHGSGGNLGGQWAAAMGGPLEFELR
jgi:hypothetical protein